MIPPRHVVLTLVAGESPEVQRRLAWGVPMPRLSVGASSDWVVTGAGVLGQHVLLSFDGYRLQARAASDTADVRLRGERLDTHWRELGLPFELAFGGGRVAGCAVAAARRSGAARESSPPAHARTVSGVGPAQPPAAQPSASEPSPAQAETQLFDLSALRAAALAPHAIVSLGAQATAGAASPRRAAHATSAASAPLEAPPPPSRRRRAKCPLPFEIVSGATLAWAIGERKTRPLGTPAAPAPGRAPAPTRVSSGARPAASLSLAQTVSDNGALKAYAQRLVAEQRQPIRTASTALSQRVRSLTGAVHGRVVASLPSLEQQRTQLAARLRRLSRRERLMALAASCCAPVLVWLLYCAAVSAGSSPTSASEPGPDIAPGRLAQALESPAAHRGEPGRPELALEGGSIDSALGAADIALATTALGTRAEQNPMDLGVFGGGDTRPRPGLEQEAYRAAFGGNTSRGVALYEELARERGDETFRQAARLLHANRVHKP